MRIIDAEIGRDASIEMASVYNILTKVCTEKTKHIIAWLPCIDTIYLHNDCRDGRSLCVQFTNGDSINLDDVGVEVELSILADDYW